MSARLFVVLLVALLSACGQASKPVPVEDSGATVVAAVTPPPDPSLAMAKQACVLWVASTPTDAEIAYLEDNGTSEAAWTDFRARLEPKRQAAIDQAAQAAQVNIVWDLLFKAMYEARSITQVNVHSAQVIDMARELTGTSGVSRVGEVQKHLRAVDIECAKANA